MIADIVEIARALFENRRAIIENKKDKCEYVAKYFEGIADTLQQVAESILANQISYTKISQLATYAEVLPKTLGNNLTLLNVEDLSRRLKQASDIKLLISEINMNQEDVVLRIEEAIGVFKALGASCRINY